MNLPSKYLIFLRDQISKKVYKIQSRKNTNKVILVHGSKEAKRCLAQKMADAVSKNDKSYRVMESFRGMIVKL